MNEFRRSSFNIGVSHGGQAVTHCYMLLYAGWTGIRRGCGGPAVFMITSAPLLLHWSSFPQEGQRFTHTHTRTQRRRLGSPPPECFPVAQSGGGEQSPAIVCGVHLVESQVNTHSSPSGRCFNDKVHKVWVWNNDICVSGLKLRMQWAPIFWIINILELFRTIIRFPVVIRSFTGCDLVITVDLMAEALFTWNCDYCIDGLCMSLKSVFIID